VDLVCYFNYAYSGQKTFGEGDLVGASEYITI